jgi:hypothetical protein
VNAASSLEYEQPIHTPLQFHAWVLLKPQNKRVMGQAAHDALA